MIAAPAISPGGTPARGAGTGPGRAGGPAPAFDDVLNASVDADPDAARVGLRMASVATHGREARAGDEPARQRRATAARADVGPGVSDVDGSEGPVKGKARTGDVDDRHAGAPASEATSVGDRSRDTPVVAEGVQVLASIPDTDTARPALPGVGTSAIEDASATARPDVVGGAAGSGVHDDATGETRPGPWSPRMPDARTTAAPANASGDSVGAVSGATGPLDPANVGARQGGTAQAATGEVHQPPAAGRHEGPLQHPLAIAGGVGDRALDPEADITHAMAAETPSPGHTGSPPGAMPGAMTVAMPGARFDAAPDTTSMRLAEPGVGPPAALPSDTEPPWAVMPVGEPGASADQGGGESITGGGDRGAGPSARETAPAVSLFPVAATPPASAPAASGAAAATSQPSMPPEASETQNVASLVQTLRVFTRPGTWEATVRLRPEHLGEVSITLTVERYTVSAVVHAERPAVREWLQAHEDQVRAGLSDHGLHLGRFAIHPEEERADSSPSRGQPRRPARRMPADAARFEITV